METAEYSAVGVGEPKLRWAGKMSPMIEEIKDPAGAPSALEQRVLVLGPMRKDAQMWRTILGEAGIDATVCTTLAQVARELVAGAAALLLTEEALAPEQTGHLVESLAGQPRWSELPILVLTHGGAESRSAAWAMDNLDNVILLQQPVQRLTLISAVRSALKHRQRQYQLREYLAEQKRQQEALHASEQRLRATFENAASGIVEVDVQGRLVAVNDRICRMLGYAREELLGKSVQELTYPEDRPRCNELNAQLRDGRIPMFELEERCLKRDGSPLWVQVARSAVRDQEGRCLYSVATLVDISARKAAEAQVRLHAAALEAAPSAISISQTDPKGTIVWVNPAFMKLTGYSAEDIVGHSHHKLSSGEHDQAFYRNLWETITRGDMWRGELVNRRKDGTIYYEEMGIKPLCDEAGKITHFIAIKQDITERKRAEEALLESEHRLRLAQQAARVGTFDWNLQADHDVWTPELEALYGLQPGEFAKTGKAWADLIHPEDRANAWQLSEQSIATGEPATGEWRVVWPDESVHWLAGRWQVFKDPSGKPLRMTGVNIDITERKRAEEALRLSEEKFAAAFTGSPAAMTLTRLEDGRFLDVNDTWMKLNGYSREEVLSPSANALLFWPTPEARARFVKELKEKGSLSGWEQELRKRSGEFLIAQLSAQVLNVAGEQLVLSSYVDITARRRAEAALQENEERLRAFLDNSAIIGWVKDEEGRHIFLSQNFEKRFNVAQGDWKGKTDFELWPREVAEQFRHNDQAVMDSGGSMEVVERTTASDGSDTWWLSNKFVFRDSSGRRYIGGLAVDITESKQTEANRHMLTEILRVLNRGGDLHGVIRETLRLIQEATGFDAVGLRLRQGEDYPYFEHNGFSEEFLHEENFLCQGRGKGAIVRDAEGRPMLDCTCGLVVSGRTDPRMPCFTEGGSFWSNVSSELLALPREVDPRTNPRNRCIHQGYQSVGLFPVRAGAEIVGLLQLDDRREGRFTPGQIAFWESVAQNIGLALQRETAEEALRQSEAQFRDLADAMPQLVWIAGPDGYHEYFNTGCHNYLGAGFDQLAGAGWLNCLHPDDRQRTLDRWDHSLRTGEPYETEYRLRRAGDGAYRWFLARAVPVRDEQGGLIRWFGTCTDIDEQKRAEERLEQRVRQRTMDLARALEDVRRSNERLNRVLEVETVGVMFWNLATGLMTDANDAFLKMMGYSRSEVEAGELTWQKLTPPEYTEASLAEIEKFQSTGRVGPYEKEYLRKDGTRQWLVFAGSSLGSNSCVEFCVDIADRKRAEAALAEKARLLELSYDAILVRDVRDGRDQITYWSRGAWESYGYTAQEALGRSPNDLLCTQLPEPLEQIWETLRNESRWTGELVHTRKDGTKINVSSRWSLDRDAKGNPASILETNRDITQHKRAEDALRESEQRLKLAYQAAKIGAFEWNVRTGVNVWSPELEAMYGLAPGEFGKTQSAWEQLIHPEDRAAAVGLVNLALETGQPVEGEWRVVRRDGSVHWIMGRFQGFKDSGGKPVRLSGVNIDITERKRAEQSLRDSEQRLRLATEAAKIGAFEWNLQTDVNIWTPELEAMYGLAPGGFGRTEAAWEQLVHPEDRAASLERVQQAFETGEPAENEWRVIWPDGSVHWILGRFQVLKDAAGRPLRMTGVNLDITARKTAEAALRELNATLEQRVAERTEALRVATAEAEQANAAKDQFLAVLSHELRTPLTPVLAAITLMKSQGDLQTEVLDLVDLIKRNVSVEARLIDDLLDLTRIVRGKILLEKAPINICDVLAQVQEICGPDIETKRLHFGIKHEKPPYAVNADASRLQQVFWNLVQNAIKFTPEGGCVGVWTYSEGDNVIVEVNDSGIGIEREALPKIFDAFEQGGQTTTRQFGGLGLGLAITKKLLDMHDGTISASSRGKGHGSTFRVVLPLIKEAPPKTDASKGDRATGVSKHILLVEDHGDTAQVLRRLLQRMGHEVEVAGDAAEALKAASQQKFDLLISDLGLPDKSGLELMQELQEKGLLATGIALSGYGREEDVLNSKQAGFIEHLTKPIDVEVLERAMRRIVTHY